MAWRLLCLPARSTNKERTSPCWRCGLVGFCPFVSPIRAERVAVGGENGVHPSGVAHAGGHGAHTAVPYADDTDAGMESLTGLPHRRIRPRYAARVELGY